ncbi:hypothetical protein JTB14_026952 [Gonioctena quinquepunctata]|nr:hypothetical protein JTB14_026952 [Gonioctena quinquepunctata]
MKNIKTICKNGFRTCGLYPFNPNNLNYNKICGGTERELGVPKTNLGKDDNFPVAPYLEQFLKYFREEIPEKIVKFEDTGEIWTGNIEDQNLSYFWLNLKRKYSHSSDHLTNMQLNDDLLYIPLEENEFALFENAEIQNQSDDTNELLLVTVPYQSSNTKLINSDSTSEPASNKNTEYSDVRETIIVNKETEKRNETKGTLIENLNDKLNTETINDKEQYIIGDVGNDISVEEIQLDELLPENHNDGSVTSESQHVDENSSLKTLERSPEKSIPDKNTGNAVGEKIPTPF